MLILSLDQPVYSSLTICINECWALVVQGHSKLLDHYLHLDLNMRQQLHFLLISIYDDVLGQRYLAHYHLWVISPLTAKFQPVRPCSLGVPNHTEPLNYEQSPILYNITRSTWRAQTSLAEADHYSHISQCNNVEPWW